MKGKVFSCTLMARTQNWLYIYNMPSNTTNFTNINMFYCDRAKLNEFSCGLIRE